MSNPDQQAQSPAPNQPQVPPSASQDQYSQQGPQKQCKKCHRSIPKYADSCPLCGANQKPFYKKAWFWILIVVLVLLAFIGSCMNATVDAIDKSTNSVSTSDGSSSSSNNSSSSDSSQKSSKSGTAEKYVITEENMRDGGYGTYYITGLFENKTNKQMSYVQVSYTLLDESGVQIGTAFANTNNLAAGTSWRFEAMALSTNGTPASYKLAEVSSW